MRRLQTFLVIVIVTWGLLALTVRAVTPLLSRYTAELESLASAKLGMPVSIGSLTARWYGLRPLLELREVMLGGSPRQLHVRKAELDLALGDLLHGSLLDSLRVTIEGLHLTVVRDAAGRVSLTGGETADSGAPLQASNLPAHLRLVDTRLVWVDEKLHRPPLAIDDIDIQFDRAGETVLLRASLDSSAGDAAFSARLQGPLDGSQWRGNSYLQVSRMDPTRLLGKSLPAGLGLHALRLDGQVWTDWTDARPRHSQGSFNLAPAAHQPGVTSEDLQRIAADFTVTRETDVIRLGLQRLDVTLAGSPWPQSDLAIAWQQGDDAPTRVELAAGFVRLQDLAGLLQQLPGTLDHDMLQTVAALAPRGELHNLRLQVSHHEGDYRWRAQTRFDGLGVAPHDRIPGVDNLAGSLLASDRHAALTLDSRAARLLFNDLFRNPIELQRLAGRIDLRRDDDGWEVRSDRLDAVTPHITTATRLHLVKQGDRPAFIDLQSDFHDGDAAHAGLYYPAGIMGKKLVTWLDHSIRSGTVISGSALAYGPLGSFAFEQTRNGNFQVIFDAEDVVIDYRDGWPALTGLDARVKFHGNQLDIEDGSGFVYDSRTEQLRAHIARLDPHAAPIRISGTVSGPLRNALRVLGEPALRPRFGEFADLLDGNGDSKLALDFEIPLSDVGETALNGRLTFTGNRLALPAYDFALDDIHGELDFDLDGLRANDIRATALNAPVRVDVQPRADGTTRVRARGNFATAAIAGQLRDLPLQGVSGSAGFVVEVDVPPRSATAERSSVLAVESDLVGIDIDLPAPLGKPQNISRALAIRVPLGDKGAAGSLHYGDRLDASFSTDGRRVGVVLGGGKASLPAKPGLQLRGHLDELDLASWQRSVEQLPAGDYRLPVDARLDIGRVVVGDSVFDDLAIAIGGNDDSWQGSVTAAVAAGTFEAPRGGQRGVIRVALERLHLPAPQPREQQSPPPDTGAGPDPAALPGLALSIADLRLGDVALGRLEASLDPVEAGLDIARIELRDGAVDLLATGGWHATGGMARTQVAGSAKAADLGALLAGLGFTRQFEDAGAEVEFALRWPGSPAQLHPATLRGDLALAIGAGRLVEVDPGVTRVIGLINLNALTRRLRLDFSDIFKKGFSFDSIEGGFAFAGGKATTADLRMLGPSGRIRIEGSTDLVAETLDQKVVVIPKLDATLPIAGTLAGGPVAGIAVLVAQQALADQVDNVYRFDYAVTGAWNDPTIEALDSGSALSKLLRPLTGIGQADTAGAPSTGEGDGGQTTAAVPPPAAGAVPATAPAAVPPDVDESPADDTPAGGAAEAKPTSATRERIDRALRKVLDLFDRGEPHGLDLPGEAD